MCRIKVSGHTVKKWDIISIREKKNKNKTEEARRNIREARRQESIK